MAKKRPTAIVRLSQGRLAPVTAWDAELLADCKDGQEFDLVRRSPRSAPHNGMYWAQLGLIVKATELFPTSDHMHRWIKYGLGYAVDIVHPKTGEVLAKTVDSTAFDKMDQAEFNEFYRQAERLIAQELGIDLATVAPGWCG